MSKKSSSGGRRRAWEILRLALLWARKGGVFRNRLVLSLNVVQKGITKKLGRHTPRGGALVYGDREFSFDETPVIHVKMSRPNSSMRFRMPHIPCIKPHDFDYDYDFEFDDDHDDNINYNVDEEACYHGIDNVEEENDGGCDDEGIDLKAEQFIAKFYEQMKLQRQISHLQYNEKGQVYEL
ncbi:hypothetical protein PHJA_000205500 [Phtheirospermum japonicum]|uniref:Uncharacterized protein n=1 Tax=Phtheirospermum japonicum TaxID=374723 RepID=A0A830B4S2_9LAMI|nr:hypothetical protein PHJA_000205500 [Phtheirospermum japonicum]